MKKNYTFKRLSNSDRNSIEQELDKNTAAREIARRLERAVSTVTDEVKRNRTISKGKNKGDCVLKVPHDACERLQSFPYVCNGCKRSKSYCTKSFRCEYSSVRAHHLAKERNRESRMGVHLSLEKFEYYLLEIRKDLKNGLSPYQISVSHKDFYKSPSTIYRWISRGYGGMKNIDLRRKVKYKERKKEKVKKYKHGINHSYERFCKLDADIRHSVCEMDTVIGRKDDKKCILTFYLRPCKFQFAILLEKKDCKEVQKVLDYLEKLFGYANFKKIFGLILTDNGMEFENYAKFEKSCLPGRTKRSFIYYCDAYTASQKASCEKNHVEIRKIIPKGQGISFDAFTNWDMATIMSQINSLPRKSLADLCPIELFRQFYGDKAADKLSVLGIEKIPTSKLCLTPNALKK